MKSVTICYFSIAVALGVDAADFAIFFPNSQFDVFLCTIIELMVRRLSVACSSVNAALEVARFINSEISTTFD